MKVLKSINNNIVSALDEDGNEVVVMGRGIGYKAKENDELPRAAIEKIFRMDSQNATDRLKQLLVEVPLENIQVSDEVIAYAKKSLGTRLSKTIYITLTDHINFAVERFGKGQIFQNALLTEVRRFYHQEYMIGEYALDIIQEKLGIRLPPDEAATIALHIVNAEYDASIGDTVNITKLIMDIVNIVKGSLPVRLDENTLYYDRFVTHVKFLAQRIFQNELLDSGDRQFTEAISGLYPAEYVCARKIGALIAQQYHHKISEEELAYLTVHIKRISTKD